MIPGGKREEETAWDGSRIIPLKLSADTRFYRVYE